MSVFDFPIMSIDGSTNLMDLARGNTCLFVNISSKCGYEPQCSRVWSYARTSRQLWELQQLHEMFKDFLVIGFPCNQFGGQEPSENNAINAFIKKAYPFVTFPISEKIEVNGDSEHPIYTYLKGPEKRLVDDTAADSSESALRGQNKAGQAMYRIPHNYEKFLVSNTGNMVARFSWRDLPLAEKPISSGSFLTVIETVKLYAELSK